MHDAAAGADDNLAAQDRGRCHVGLGVDGWSLAQVSYPHLPNVPASPAFRTFGSAGPQIEDPVAALGDFGVVGGQDQGAAAGGHLEEAGQGQGP